jgi:hypothetical protein
MGERIRFPLIFVLILTVGALLRLHGLYWDDMHGLHPDERFMSMVTNDCKLPPTFLDYLDPRTSSLNPYNCNFSFFVYGTLPVGLNKYLIGYFMQDNYRNIFLFGRILSALFDLSTMIAVWMIGRTLRRHYDFSSYFECWAMLAYALLVLPIQQSHFYTTDTFGNAFSTWALWICLEAHFSGKLLRCAFPAGLLWGGAMACKISGLYLLPLLLALLVIPADAPLRPLSFAWCAVSNPLRKIGALIVFFLFGYLALRIGDPHFFAVADWLQPRISPQYAKNIAELRASGNYTGGIPYPPAVQWINKRDIWFPLQNILYFGLGIFSSFLALTGLFSWRRWRSMTFLLVLGWSLVFFCYQASAFAKTLRYFYVLYPLFAVLIAQACVEICANFATARGQRIASACLAFLLVLWPVAFSRIYSVPHPRIAASRWMIDNIPNGSKVGCEHWDDCLPIGIEGAADKHFQHIELAVFGPDDENKWRNLTKARGESEYMVLSSNRAYGSMMTQPELFPRTARYYQDLFAGRTEWERLAQFASFPGISIGGFNLFIDDQWSEEAFTVFDHPLVTLFKKRSGSQVPLSGPEDKADNPKD